MTEKRRVVGSRIEVRPGVHRLFAPRVTLSSGKSHRPTTTFRGNGRDAEKALQRWCDMHSSKRPFELEKRVPTVGEFYSEWAEMKRSEVRRNTWTDYDQKYRLYIKPDFEKVVADRVNSHTLKLWIARLRKRLKTRQPTDPEAPRELLSETTVHAACVVFDMLLEEMHLAGFIESNPMKRVIPKAPNPCPVVGTLSQDEVEGYLSALRDSSVEAFVLTQIGTGARRGEVAALTWSDYEFWTVEVDGARVPLGSISISKSLYQYGGDVWQDAPKTEKSAATVMIVPRFVPRLKELRSVGPICCDGLGPMAPDKIARVYKRIISKAGLRFVPLQRLRHSFAMLALDAGVPLRVVQEWLRHTSSRTTERYVAASLDRQVAVAPELVRKWGAG